MCWVIFILEGDAFASKRARLLVDDHASEEDVVDAETDEFTFEDLCGDAAFSSEVSGNTVSEVGSWGLLDGHLLARVLHFLRSDLKSLVFVSMTCKNWRESVRFYKEVSRSIDLSSLGYSCTDSIVWNIVVGLAYILPFKIVRNVSLSFSYNLIISLQNAYEKDKIKSMILTGCTNITAGMLEKILLSFPGLSTVYIRGCSQFEELTPKFTKVKWIQSRSSCIRQIAEEPHEISSLKQITVLKTSSLGIRDDFGELKNYLDSVDKRDMKQLFRRNLYKRSKLYDARKSSSILSRDARTRRWSIKKSDCGYKRMEEFLASRLREIMKANSCDFFVSKVHQ